ncbi:SRPBCC family protein [Lipingzhangella sp. LS1_29]|uniref:SRPBCC family protein n=1 Tax=Lipingzhangella rawalii TaxID=2055835 RepID=A0ABU2HAV4_9ACTN|nr:SRPBCC family protein [Lipingzhangella rawalii]MDS1272455.1 SRPBCC family protein [Lipingzhangella rawalii]
MRTYDLLDEAVIPAPPTTVWSHLVDELSGARRWWVPYNTFEVRSGAPDQMGGEVQWTVHTRGVGRGGPKIRFLSRTTSVTPGTHLELAYVSGAFHGSAEFSLEPVGDGARTRLGLRFQARPRGWVRLLAGLAPVDQEHSRAAHAAFAALATLLAAEQDHLERSQ